MLLSLIRMIQAFRDYQRNVSELPQLSDRELADIGLDRSHIPRVAAGTYNGRSAPLQPPDERITPPSRRASGVLDLVFVLVRFLHANRVPLPDQAQAHA